MADIYEHLLTECIVESTVHGICQSVLTTVLQVSVIAANSFTDQGTESWRGHRRFQGVTRLVRSLTSVSVLLNHLAFWGGFPVHPPPRPQTTNCISKWFHAYLSLLPFEVKNLLIAAEYSIFDIELRK